MLPLANRSAASRVAETAANSAAPALRLHRGGRLARLLSWTTWLYLAAMIATAVLLWTLADAWWPATVFAFGPRWIVLAPLPVLVVAALISRRRLLIPLTIAALIALGPVMGFNIPWRSWFAAKSSSGSTPITLVSCNIGGGTDMARLDQYLREINPDIIALQETSGIDTLPAGIASDRYFARYGGLLVASRYEIVHVEKLTSPKLAKWRAPALRCDLQTPGGIVSFFCVHLETPRSGLEDIAARWWRGADSLIANTAYRRIESELTSQFVAAAPGPVIIAGDFNMPAESQIFQDYWADYQNAFTTAGLGFGYSKFTRYFGVRIDHVLASLEIAPLSIDLANERTGDHAPLRIVIDVP